jgi:hypothetical protein
VKIEEGGYSGLNREDAPKGEGFSVCLLNKLGVSAGLLNIEEAP